MGLPGAAYRQKITKILTYCEFCAIIDPKKGGDTVYPVFKEMLSDKKDGIVFEYFGIWHFMYIALVIGLITFFIVYFKRRDEEQRRRITNVFIDIVFVLYMADFFLMPFALGEIDVDKLPFHSCTSMCIMCFWSNHNRFLGRFRVNFALLGALCNVMYIVYPSGVVSYETHPLSYRAAQTLLFHGLMIVYGVLVILFDENGLKLKRCYRDAVILLCLTGWAFIGNTIYSGEAGNYSRSFNWFFIRQDPFFVLPETIAPIVAPILNFIAFFSLEIIVYLIYGKVKSALALRESKKLVDGARQEAAVQK